MHQIKSPIRVHIFSFQTSKQILIQLITTCDAQVIFKAVGKKSKETNNIFLLASLSNGLVEFFRWFLLSIIIFWCLLKTFDLDLLVEFVLWFLFICSLDVYHRLLMAHDACCQFSSSFCNVCFSSDDCYTYRLLMESSNNACWQFYSSLSYWLILYFCFFSVVLSNEYQRLLMESSNDACWQFSSSLSNGLSPYAVTQSCSLISDSPILAMMIISCWRWWRWQWCCWW